MQRMHLSEDIRPLSEFRANAAAFIKQVQNTGRPLVLTQRGHSAAIVLDVKAYEQLLEEIELLRDVYEAEREMDGSDGALHDEAKALLLDRLG